MDNPEESPSSHGERAHLGSESLGPPLLLRLSGPAGADLCTRLHEPYARAGPLPLACEQAIFAASFCVWKLSWFLRDSTMTPSWLDAKRLRQPDNRLIGL